MMMNLKDYLSDISEEEITQRLIYLSRSLKDLHSHGYYLVCNLEEIVIIDGKITMASFKGKYDYINSGFNVNGVKMDILKLCSIAICAYNRKEQFNSNFTFTQFLRANIDKFVENDLVPEIMQEYLIDVLERGNYTYLSDYYEKNYVDKVESGMEKGRQKIYATEVGKALTNHEENREAAYVDILLVPALITLVYLTIIVASFIFSS